MSYCGSTLHSVAADEPLRDQNRTHYGYSRIPTFASVPPLDIVYIQLLLCIIRHLPPSQTTLNNLRMTYYESRLRIMTTTRNALVQAYSFAYGIFMCIVVSNIIIYNVPILSDSVERLCYM